MDLNNNEIPEFMIRRNLRPRRNPPPTPLTDVVSEVMAGLNTTEPLWPSLLIAVAHVYAMSFLWLLSKFRLILFGLAVLFILYVLLDLMSWLPQTIFCKEEILQYNTNFGVLVPSTLRKLVKDWDLF